MSTYTVPFGNASLSGPGVVTIYTAPAGVVSVVRNLSVGNGDATPAQIIVAVHRGATLLGYLYRSPTHPAQTVVNVELRHCMEVGDTLTFQTVGTNATLLVTGYQLAG